MHSGKQAHLELKSLAGKAMVHLTVEVENDDQFQPRVQPRNGPARQWRREKRAAERDAAAVAADQSGDGPATEKVAEESAVQDIEKDTPTNHKVNITEKVKKKSIEETEKVENEKAKKKVKVVENTTIPDAEVNDELCPNESYELKSQTSLSYSAAAAPTRKLGSFDYYSLKYLSVAFLDLDWNKD